MTDNDARLDHSTARMIAGIALIVVPILAIAVKFASFGWFMVLAIWTVAVPLLLLIGWVMQIVVASTGCFGARAAFAGGRSGARGVAAAWTTSIGALLVALFFVDGGDASWGSTFMYWTGTTGNDGVGALSTTITWIALIPWIGGWFWLVVEWIAALVRRSRRGA